MTHLIDKDALVAEIERRIEYYENIQMIKPVYESNIEDFNELLSFIDTLEVKDMSMPSLDNGNMPVERWKEACEAASCQANYRNSKGLTKTCDDYFVDGVQWADEHPKKAKEVDLEKEIDTWYQNEASKEFENVFYSDIENCAKHFFELGLNTSNPLTWEDIANINDIVSKIIEECDGNILYDTKEDFCKEVLKRFKAQKGEEV